MEPNQETYVQCLGFPIEKLPRWYAGRWLHWKIYHLCRDVINVKIGMNSKTEQYEVHLHILLNTKRRTYITRRVQAFMDKAGTNESRT